MKKFTKLLITFLSLVVLTALGLTSAACTTAEADPVYYLTTKAGDWKSYSSEAEIPAEVKFTKSEGEYTLTVKLEKDDELLIADVNSSKKIGFDKLVAEGQALVAGENDNLKVAESGTFVLTVKTDWTEKLDYTFTSSAVPEVTVSSVEIAGGDTLVLGLNEDKKLSATVTYSDKSTDADVVWTTDDAEVVTVDGEGNVSAVAEGITDIVATSKKDDTKFALVTVTVARIEVASVELDKQSVTLELDGEDTLTATVLPANAANKNVSWSSSAPEIVSVEDGAIKALNYGTATITVTTINKGLTATCTVTVRKPVQNVSAPATFTVAVDGSRSLVPSFTPADATNKDFTFEVTAGNDNITAVKQNGALVISGVAEGTASIKITSVDNDQATCTVEVTVSPAGTVIAALDRTTLTMIKTGPSVNASGEINVEFGADIKSIEWEGYNGILTLTADDTVATKFTVTATALGYRRIRAAITDADDAVHYTDYCDVFVTNSFFSILGKLSPNSAWDAALYESEAAAQANNALFVQDEQDACKLKLTRHFEKGDTFQIIGQEYSWDNLKANAYVDTANSQHIGISTDGKNVNISESGNYTVVIEFVKNATTTAVKDNFKVCVVCNSLDLKSLELSNSESATLVQNDVREISVTAGPTGVTFEEGDVQVELISEADIDSYATVSYNHQTKKITLTVTGDPTELISAKVKCTISGVSAEYNFSIKSSTAGTVKPTSVTFGASSYAIDYGGTKTVQVSAAVDAASTEKGIVYSVKTGSESGIEVTAAGVVTGKALGTFTLVATAESTNAAGETVSAEVQVTVYSTFWIVGEVDGKTEWGDGSTPMDGRTLTDDGTHKIHTLENVVLSGAFRLLYGGSGWAASINYSHLSECDSRITYNTSGNSDKNIISSEKAVFNMTVDLSGATPKLKITYVGAYEAPPAGELTDGTATVVFCEHENEETVFFNQEVTITKGKATVQVTFTGAAASSDSWAHVSLVTIKVGDTKQDVSPDNISGDAFNATWTTGKWYYYAGDKKYQFVGAPSGGDELTGRTFQFELTFNEDNTAITAMVITEV